MSYPLYPNTYKRDIKIADKIVSIEVGKFTEQAAAAVLTQSGETIVHTTIALGRKVDLGYFPLSVEYAEKLFASGTIKGSRWVKRDGRPSDDSILKGRVIDRSLRPMFPDGMTHEVQVISTVLSYDGQNQPDMLALIGACVGLSISQIPFEGPMAGMRIGYIKESSQFIYNPTITEQEKSSLDLIVSGTGSTVVMVEAGADEVSEEVVVEALVKSQEIFAGVCGEISEIVAEIGKEKLNLVVINEEKEAAKAALKERIKAQFGTQIRAVVEKEGRLEESGAAAVIAEIMAFVNEGVTDEAALISEGAVKEAFSSLNKQVAREMIINEKLRPDGRKTDEVRQIWCEVDLFPRTHGSAMFKRGATQAVTVTTLGAPNLGQLIESIEGEETHHYMHHYNMPPYASGEAGRFGMPKRREIGHGALAERALLPMLPSQEEFPYAIHVVSEIMSSNGSTSQASVCGSTMSLMAAGVPLKRPVAGIAMGLMSDGTNYVVLSDIQGLEDHVGDMDFKVAGTSEGITAIQMDIKLKGVPRTVLEQALEQAKAGRAHIMGKMLECISTPRQTLSVYAPKIEQVTIPGDRIGELIGPGGRNIKALIEETGAQIDVDEDETRGVGLVNISSQDASKIAAAKSRIQNMFREINVNDEFDGTVTRVESYGAFVEFLEGREGLVHVSQMSTEFVRDASDLMHEGDSVHVRVNEIKDDGKIGLTMLTPEQQEEQRANRPPQGDRGGDRGGFGGGRGRGGDRGGRGGDRGGRPTFDRPFRR